MKQTALQMKIKVKMLHNISFFFDFYTNLICDKMLESERVRKIHKSKKPCKEGFPFQCRRKTKRVG
jgi:hypothetical protein